MRRLFVGIAGSLAALLLAIVLGAIPVPVSGQAALADTPEDGVRIYVLSNGFHSDIAVPAQDGEAFAAMGLDVRDFPVAIAEVEYWAVGWGSRTAYTSLREVSDLTPRIALTALAFDTTVMHVLPLRSLSPGGGVYAYDITREAYSRLLSGMSRSFGESVRLIPEISQGFGDRFYKARGRFAPWTACNVWTGRQLRRAGIGVGLWTPFAQSLEFGLEHTSAQVGGSV